MLEGCVSQSVKLVGGWVGGNWCGSISVSAEEEEEGWGEVGLEAVGDV